VRPGALAEPAQRRRRLEEPQERGNRSGCLFLGAILGIIVGIMFALYGLPPILRAIYGEDSVAAGSTYDQNAKTLTVESVERLEGQFVVTMAATTNKTWDLEPHGIKLEISTQDEWLELLPPDPSQPGTSLDFVLGQPRTLVLHFAAPTRVDARPVALHFADPRVRFELEGLEQ
jgi:hypothetical protein